MEYVNIIKFYWLTALAASFVIAETTTSPITMLAAGASVVVLLAGRVWIERLCTPSR